MSNGLGSDIARKVPHRSAAASLPESYAALAIPGPGESVRAIHQSLPACQDDDVLVRVGYASINRMDPALARGNAFNFPLPYVLGFDFSGEVVRVGANAGETTRVGDQVFGRSLTGGCFAQFVVAKPQNLVQRGDLPAEEASTFGIAYLTAYEALVMSGGIERYKGKWIYIAGAAGGVGHFAAQIAKLHGLHVIGSAGKLASLDLLRKLKLAAVVDYSTQDVRQEVLALTHGKGADLVFDSTYTQASYDQSAAVVASGGQYVRLGTDVQLARSGARNMTSVVEQRGAQMTIADLGRYGRDPFYMTQVSKLRAGLQQAVVWWNQALLKPIITNTVPFEASALQEAFDTFMNGTSNVGKVVVHVSFSADEA